MSAASPSNHSELDPVKNLRICFWGVQGSCPMFPEASEVAEFERLSAINLLTKVVTDVQSHSRNGHGCKVEDLLGGPLTPENLEAYQRKLGNSNLPTYGGDTTCISIETADGDLMVIDGGSGIRNCSKHFTNHWPATKPREIYIFGTHEHLDHRSGLPFSQFCFVRPPFRVNILSGYQFLHALDERYGIFTRKITASTHLDDPLDYRVMAATFYGTELRNFAVPDCPSYAPPWQVRDVNEPIKINQTTVTAFDVYHGTVRCLAYKIQRAGASFVFCTDHELRHGTDPRDERQIRSAEADARLTEQCRDVDVAYFDGQYFRLEYDGKEPVGLVQATSRVDWGHGCIEDVVERAVKCRIKRSFIGHHDPERTWMARLEMDRWLAETCSGQPYEVELAKSEYVVDL
jgi:hypothetical protein